MPQRTLSNKRVILTGASSGIGWQLAKQLAAAGAKLCVTARRSDRPAILKSKIALIGPSPVGAILFWATAEHLSDFNRSGAIENQHILISEVGEAAGPPSGIGLA